VKDGIGQAGIKDGDMGKGIAERAINRIAAFIQPQGQAAFNLQLPRRQIIVRHSPRQAV